MMVYQVVANLKTFGKGNKVTFTYGGGRGGRETRGAEAQADIGEATFMVESMGSSDGDFVDITTTKRHLNPLMIEVKGAESGSGEGEVEIVKRINLARGYTTVKPMWTTR